jgi:single-strand DNA-binding protein
VSVLPRTVPTIKRVVVRAPTKGQQVSNLNVVAITGNLTKDPELRSTHSGTPVCSLRVAVNTRVKRDGEWTDKPNYFDVTVWGKRGENTAKYLAKGSGIGVQGRLDWREWEDKQGNKRQSVEIIADDVQWLDGKRDGKRGTSSSNDQASSDFAPPDDGSFGVPAGTSDDDIPF